MTDAVFILGAGRAGRGLSRALRASGVDVIGLHGRHVELEPDVVTAGPLPAALAGATGGHRRRPRRPARRSVRRARRRAARARRGGAPRQRERRAARGSAAARPRPSGRDLSPARPPRRPVARRGAAARRMDRHRRRRGRDRGRRAARRAVRRARAARSPPGRRPPTTPRRCSRATSRRCWPRSPRSSSPAPGSRSDEAWGAIRALMRRGRRQPRHAPPRRRPSPARSPAATWRRCGSTSTRSRREPATLALYATLSLVAVELARRGGASEEALGAVDRALRGG